MRSFILVVTSVFGLAIGFLVYYWVQPTHRATAQKHGVIAPPLVSGNDGDIGGVGTSSNIWIKKPDHNGDLASEYFADEAKPTKSGQIEVINPRARFYLNAGQVLEITGTDGIFVEDHPSKRGVDDKSQTSTPNRGHLHNVVVRLLDSEVTDPDRQVLLTIAMDNAAFDAENTTIYTEAIPAQSGSPFVPSDEVPVALRGVDYDFDGRGLRLSWNERDRRLAKLDVMHGERLVIKNPSKFSASNNTTTELAPTGPSASLPLPEAYASAAEVIVPSDAAAPATEPLTPRTKTRTRARAEAAAAAAAAAATQPSGFGTPATDALETGPGKRRRPPVVAPRKLEPNTAPPLYRATFVDHVQILGLTPQQWSSMPPERKARAMRIAKERLTAGELREQNFELLAISDRMFVDFMLRPEGSATTQPSTVPATHPSAGRTTTVAAPATQPALAAGATTSPTTQAGRHGRRGAGTAVATTAPAPKPAEPPMFVYWTGPLHVVPYAMQPLMPGDAVVTLEGAPVVAQQQGSEIRAARLVYRTQEKDVQADAAPNGILTMTSHDPRGDTIVHTQSLTYSQAHPSAGSNAAGVAVLRGRSTATLPSQADGAKLNAAWTQQCTLTFVNLSEGRQAIDRAEMRGDVKVDHPQMKLDAQELDLTFDNKPTTRPTPVRTGTSQPIGQPVLAATALPPATAPSAAGGFQSNLDTIIATNRVHCVMINPEKKLQTIDCDRLTVLNSPTPDGRFSPRTINADGQVHAVDTEQDLKAGHLAVTLTPSTKPATTRPAPQLAGAAPATQPVASQSAFGGNVELQSLIAHESVKVVNFKDGTEATADTLLVDRDKADGKPTIRLVGQPTAKIIDKTSTITGPIIVIYPDGQQLAVDGAGTMRGAQQETPGATTRPIFVVWDRSMRVDGKKNVVDAIGNVTATMTDADGSEDVARGDQAQLLLVDLMPTTQPTTRRSGAQATAPTTQPLQVAAPSDVPLTPGSGAVIASGRASIAATAPSTPRSASGTTGVGESPMGHKAVRRAVFQDNAQVSSTLLAADGSLLRRMKVLAQTIQYDVDQTGPVPQKKVTIPVPGRMLVEDYRTPATQPATTVAATQPAGAGGSARGATAFRWQKSLVYDDATHLMTMEGDVIIDHRDPGQQENGMRLTGDVVNAELETLPPLPATNPTTRPASTEPRYQIKRITAMGNLTLLAKGGELTADNMEYDPVKHVMIARGGARPAVFRRAIIGPTGSPPIEADEMQWDTISELPTITKMSGRMRK